MRISADVGGVGTRHYRASKRTASMSQRATTLPMKILCAILRAFYISFVDSSRVNVCAWQCIVHGGLGGESSNGRTLWRGNSAVKQKAHSVQVMWKSIDLCYATAFCDGCCMCSRSMVTAPPSRTSTSMQRGPVTGQNRLSLRKLARRYSEAKWHHRHRHRRNWHAR